MRSANENLQTRTTDILVLRNPDGLGSLSYVNSDRSPVRQDRVSIATHLPSSIAPMPHSKFN